MIYVLSHTYYEGASWLEDNHIPVTPRNARVLCTSNRNGLVELKVSLYKPDDDSIFELERAPTGRFYWAYKWALETFKSKGETAARIVTNEDVVNVILAAERIVLISSEER